MIKFDPSIAPHGSQSAAPPSRQNARPFDPIQDQAAPGHGYGQDASWLAASSLVASAPVVSELPTQPQEPLVIEAGVRPSPLEPSTPSLIPMSLELAARLPGQYAALSLTAEAPVRLPPPLQLMPIAAADTIELVDIPVQPPVQLVLVGAGGAVELIDAPWGLRATGHLAQSTKAHVGVTPALPAEGKPQFSGVIGVTANLPHGSTQSSAFSPGVARAQPGAVPVLSTLVQAIADANDADGEATQRALAASPFHWAERVMRWVERHGHPAVLVRDYRLDEAGTQQLADRLHAFAAERGITLERVVINGQAFVGPRQPEQKGEPSAR